MNKRLMLIGTALLLSAATASAQKRVTGRVVDTDGQPIAGASVRVQGHKGAVATDANGNFTLSGVSSSAKKISIAYIGKETQIVNIGQNLVVTLKDNDTTLSEAMVIAYGKTTKAAFTGSAAVVNNEALAKAQVSDVTAALAGAVPGLTLTSANGAPGASPTIRVRGFSSLNAGKDPLIIVDGAPYSGDLNNINPNDIDNLTVLKDAASSALYGARGANGVIIITTKQAAKGKKGGVTFDAKWGVNSRALQHYDVISDPGQWVEMQYEALKNYYVSKGQSATEAWHSANTALLGRVDAGGLGYQIYTVPDGQYMIGQNGRLNPNATLGYSDGEYYYTPDDWEKEGTRHGFRQEYNVSFNGSTDRSNFYLSLGYLSNDGITYNSDYERFSGRFRADYQVTKWLKVGANMSYARFNGNSLSNNGTSSSTANVWAFTSQIAPIYPLYVRNADGSIKTDENGIRMMDYGAGEQSNGTRQFINNANALQDVLLNTKNAEGNFSSGNAFANFNFTPNWSLQLNGTYNLTETRQTYVYNRYYGQFDDTNGTVAKAHSRSYTYDFQQVLNYTNTFRQVHNLNVMVGHDYYDSRYSELSASKSGMFSDDNKELDGAVVDGKDASSYKERYNNEGYFGRVQYDFDGKYFASASYRRDASSRFAKENRWGNFWSVGAAWILSKEAWYNLSWLDMLKVKASIGSQGNDNIDNYLYSDLYSIKNSNGDVGTSFYSKGNKDITWETQTNLNIGVEFSLWKRLSGSLEYYYRKTTDMLMSYSTATSIGYASYYANVGDLYNTGLELTLNANIIQKRNVQWDVNFNIASIKNRITSLDAAHKNETYYTPEGEKVKGFRSGNFYVAEGQSIYTWRLKDYAGVDPETGQSLWYKNVYATNEDGSYRLDADGDKIVTGRETTSKYSDADYYVTEKTTVPKFQGGFGTTVKFYGFDLSVNLSFQLGGKGYDSGYATFMYSPTSSNNGYNYHKDLLKAWSTTNTGSDIPRFQYNDDYTSSSSTRFLTSTSYLNIESINLGYTLPQSVVSKCRLSSLRLYVACQNVAYISARKGFDPRVSYSSAYNPTYYSPMRTISGGITIQL